jgi:hypothetical protein
MTCSRILTAAAQKNGELPKTQENSLLLSLHSFGFKKNEFQELYLKNTVQTNFYELS